ncbi:hypothetical protein D8B46_08155 [Candidatus Gracilibacteria bacterium]|nr:MAG: hypothetical protein D8B46_08155 [Candidatus Gracilibacteria bacterium]
MKKIFYILSFLFFLIPFAFLWLKSFDNIHLWLLSHDFFSLLLDGPFLFWFLIIFPLSLSFLLFWIGNKIKD